MRVIVSCTIEDEREECLSSADQRYLPYGVPTNDAIRFQIARALRFTPKGGRVRVSAKLDGHYPIVTMLPKDDRKAAKEYQEAFLRKLVSASTEPTRDLALEALLGELATE